MKRFGDGGGQRDEIKPEGPTGEGVGIYILIYRSGGVFVLMKRGARMECAMTIVSTLR